MKRSPVVVCSAFLIAGVLACGPGASVQTQPTSAPADRAGASSTPVPTETPTASSPGAGFEDVFSYVACEIVTPQEVADLIGGPLFRELPQQPSPNCTYEVVAGPTNYAQWIVYIQPTDWVEPLIDNMPETLGDPLPDLGDAAYLKYEEGTDTYDLLVLVKGRFGLEVVGSGEDWTLAIGKLFLSRLQGP